MSHIGGGGSGGGSSGLVPGTTPIAPSIDRAVLWDNAGVLGEDATFKFPSSGTLLLGLAGTVTGKLNIAGTTSGVITLTGKAIAGTWTMTLPDNDGNANDVLTTDGSGILSWAPASTTITVGVSTITGGTTKHVAYDLAGVFQEAANFTIESGNPNVTTGNTYLYNNVNALRAVTANRDWFIGNCGNLTLSGADNLGMGDAALNNLTTGARNMAMGRAALNQAVDGVDNVAVGSFAASVLTSGISNTAIGSSTLSALIDGNYNVAIGFQTLASSQHGVDNIGIGLQSLVNCNASNGNVGIGTFSLVSYTGSGGRTTGVGHQAGSGITTGDFNTCIGGYASRGGPFGGVDLTTGSQCISIGYQCSHPSGTANGQIVIGNYIYGTGCTGTAATISSGKIGLGTSAPNVELDVAGFINWNGQKRVSTQFDKVNNTLANITGLSATIKTGRSYQFTAVLFTTSDVSAGVQAAIAGTATASAIIYEANVFDTGVLKVPGTTRAAALATKVGDVTAVTVARIDIKGLITCNGNGTLTVQFAQNVTNAGVASSVLVGSYFIVQDVQ